MRLLEREDVEKVIKYLNPKIVQLVKENDLFIAGGFIRSVVEGKGSGMFVAPADLDLFSKSLEQARDVAKQLGEAFNKGVFETSNAITVNLGQDTLEGLYPTQFITRWLFNSPASVINSFDFTIAQAVIFYRPGCLGGKGYWTGLCSETFYEDVKEKKLVYTSPVREEDAAGSLLRVIKFSKKGFSIDDVNLGKVVTRVWLAAEKLSQNENFAASDDEIMERVIKSARPEGGGSV